MGNLESGWRGAVMSREVQNRLPWERVLARGSEVLHCFRWEAGDRDEGSPYKEGR